MERLLSRYIWNFALVYVDDIIIYSRSKELHLEHLVKVLATLADSRISLSLRDCISFRLSTGPSYI